MDIEELMFWLRATTSLLNDLTFPPPNVNQTKVEVVDYASTIQMFNTDVNSVRRLKLYSDKYLASRRLYLKEMRALKNYIPRRWAKWGSGYSAEYECQYCQHEGTYELWADEDNCDITVCPRCHGWRY